MTWSIRPAEGDDVLGIARVHRGSRLQAMPWLPDLHTPAEDVAFLAGEVASSTAIVAVEDDRVVGLAIARDGWLRHLYVDPGHQGRGVGSALLDRIVEPGMRLWAFQRNTRALDFYRERGFVEVERTDGSGNEEREPDVLLQRQ